jgi:hypothetical protein
MSTVNLTLRVEDAEPILWKAAYEAALYGARVDYVPRNCYDSPFSSFSKSYDECKREANEHFLRAKRIVEAFGVGHEPTSEAETLTIAFPPKKGTGSTYVPNHKRPTPDYRGAVHVEACKAAADRVIRSWKQTLDEGRAAA